MFADVLLEQIAKLLHRRCANPQASSTIAYVLLRSNWYARCPFIEYGYSKISVSLLSLLTLDHNFNVKNVFLRSH